MDYNYVRMRNALSSGDTKLAERYRKLYENGGAANGDSKALNIILAVLLFAAIALGIYATLSTRANIDAEPAATEAVQGEEDFSTPEVVSAPME